MLALFDNNWSKKGTRKLVVVFVDVKVDMCNALAPPVRSTALPTTPTRNLLRFEIPTADCQEQNANPSSEHMGQSHTKDCY